MNRRLARTQAGRRSGFSVIELLVVIALFAIVAAIAVPASAPAVGGYRLAGAAREVFYNASLAKMRAAANFTRARLQVDLSGGTARLQWWDRTTSTWTTEGGTAQLPPGVWFGFGSLAAPPPNTQGTIGQAAVCLNDAATALALLGQPYPAPAAGTACLQFNSRGVPVDATGAPTGTGAIYLTDGSTVYGTTVSATGMAQLWWTRASAAAWQRQ
jgi:prepilin-type N-terminal cleavage/methylation domain-containing protein